MNPLSSFLPQSSHKMLNRWDYSHSCFLMSNIQVRLRKVDSLPLFLFLEMTCRVFFACGYTRGCANLSVSRPSSWPWEQGEHHYPSLIFKEMGGRGVCRAEEEKKTMTTALGLSRSGEETQQHKCLECHKAFQLVRP